MTLGAPKYEILAKSLNQRLFHSDPDTKIKIAEAVREARRIGAFTLADVVVLGTHYFYRNTHLNRFNEQRAELLFNGVWEITGFPVREETAAPRLWPRFYEYLEQASPAILLPAQGEDFAYESFADFKTVRQPLTMGDMLHPHFVESYGTELRQRTFSASTNHALPVDKYHERLAEADAAARGMQQFIEQCVAPAVERFTEERGPSPA